MDKHTDYSETARAIPFIIMRDNKGFEVTPEAIAFLNTLSAKKLAVISIVGKYRTGKSYFINKVLLNMPQRAEGFAVGPTVNPCTKGLWLWNRTIPASNFGGDSDLEVLIMDTEGFGGVDEGVNHDTRIFLFSILLSSFFIYNSVGSIDENALQSLSLIINIAKDIRVKAFGQDSEEDLAAAFPTFLWVVRDFILSIEDNKGRNMTPKEYLENALALQKGISEQTEAKNRIRKHFKQFFQNRDCMTFVRPAKNEYDLRNLEKISDDQLREEFVNEINRAREKIFQTVKAKSIAGRNLSGPLFLEAVYAYVEAVNSGKVPNIEQIWNYACQEASRKAFQDSMKLLDKALLAQKADITGKGLGKDARRQIEKEILKEFKIKAVGDKKQIDEMKEKLERAIAERLDSCEKTQQRELEKELQALLDRKTCFIKNQVLSNALKGIEEVQREFDLLTKEILSQETSDSWKNEYVARLVAEKEKEVIYIILNKKAEMERVGNEKLAQLEEEAESFKHKARSLEEENQDLKLKEIRYDANLKNMAREIEDLQKRLDSTRLESQEKVFQLKQLQSEIEIRKQRESLDADNLEKRFKNEMDRQSLEHEREKAELRKNHSLALNQAELYKKEMQRKDEEYKQLQQQLERLQETNAHLTDRLRHQSETMQPKSDENAKELKESLAKAENTIIELKMNKQYLTDQLEFYKMQTEESRKLYERLILTASAQRNSNETVAQSDLLATNKSLSASLAKLQSKNKVLEDTIQYLKPFKKVLKNSRAVQCQKCSNLINPNSFLTHIENCANTQKFEKSLSSINNFISNATNAVNNELPQQFTLQQIKTDAKSEPVMQMPVFTPVSVKVEGTCINNDGPRPVIQYVMKVSQEGREWQVLHKFKEFKELYGTIVEQFPTVILPKSCRVIHEYYSDMAKLLQKNQKPSIQDNKVALEKFMNDLSEIPQICGSQIFKEFLNIRDSTVPIRMANLDSKNGSMLIAKEGKNYSKDIKENRSVNYYDFTNPGFYSKEGNLYDDLDPNGLSGEKEYDLRDDYGSEIPTPENLHTNPQKKFHSVKNESMSTSKGPQKRLFIN
jgi:hypothetical protein